MQQCVWLLTGLALTAAGQTLSKARPERVAIVAIGYGEQGLETDPVAITERGKLISPYEDVSAEGSKAIDSFKRDFYRIGTRVSLYGGGLARGTARITGTAVMGGTDNPGCIFVTAQLSPGRSKEVYLGTIPETAIRGHRSLRSPASSKERDTLQRLGVEWFAQHGKPLGTEQLRQVSLGDKVVSTVLRVDGGRALIGRMEVKAINVIHHLTMVAEQEHGSYRLTLAEFHTQEDLEDQKDRYETEYVDQLDLDGDSVDEMVTKVVIYEYFEYVVWKFNSGTKNWEQIYQGGGAGC
jgi:hypothetical protein